MYPDCSPVVLAAPVKVCTKCGEVKPATQEYFHRRSNGTLSAHCILCARAHKRQFYIDNHEQESARHKRYYDSHLGQKKARDKTYRETNPEKKAASVSAWKSANREWVANYRKAYSEANKEILQARRRTYRSEKPWLERAQKQRRRARKNALPDVFTASDWQIAIDYFNGCCAVCGRQPGLWHTIAADHWIPLTAFDCPGTVAWNIVPLCHDRKGGAGGCNNSKLDKPPTDWLIGKFGKRKGRAILKRIEAFLNSRRTKGEVD